jgi:acyl carrier protein
MSSDASLESIRIEVKELLQKITEGKAGSVTDGDRLREDLGLDSLDSMELLSCLCERYNVDIEPDDVAEVRTFGQIVDFVHKTIAKGQAGPAA